ncbi:MAG TPA: SUF system NifU family Fe-S cluster assembly protein [Planctomycetota bacterium]|nr:SUF system NifU family Fe-S cluster assembly protein [Planctomycetota bacterium]
MSDQLRELYQELILDHNKKPRNRRPMADATADADGFNPLCGDRIHVFVKLLGDRIEDVSFDGMGCAISTASASLMTTALKGKTIAEARALFQRFHEMVTGEPGAAVDADALGKLAVFQGVCEFPVRVKCATLCWHTLKAAIDRSQETVTTE